MHAKTRGYETCRTTNVNVKLPAKLRVNKFAKRQSNRRHGWKAGDYTQMLHEMTVEGLFTPAEFTVLFGLTWKRRLAGTNRCEDVTYKQLHEVSGRCKDVAVSAVSKAVGYGILRKAKSRVRRAVGAFVRVVNGANSYFLQFPEPDTADLEQDVNAAEAGIVSQSAAPATSVKLRDSIIKRPPIDSKSPLEKALSLLAGSGGFVRDHAI